MKLKRGFTLIFAVEISIATTSCSGLEVRQFLIVGKYVAVGSGLSLDPEESVRPLDVRVSDHRVFYFGCGCVQDLHAVGIASCHRIVICFVLEYGADTLGVLSVRVLEISGDIANGWC
jgi:hypothetical protein